MHITRAFVVVATATLAATLTAAPASAGPPDHAQNATTYHGTWVEGTSGMTSPGAECTPADEVEGVWNMTLKKDGTANVSIALFVNGYPYSAWGGNVWMDRFTWVSTADGIVATLDGGYAPVPLTVELTFGPSGDTVTFTFEDLFDCGDGYLLGDVR